jgi:hypothetical protein
VRRTLPLLLAATLLAACGGGGRLSRAEYAKRADAICAGYKRKIEALPQPRSLAQLQALTAKAVPITRQTAEKLRDLKPPKDEQKTADAWNDSNGEILTAMVRIRDAAKKNDRSAITSALRDANNANRRSNDLARTLGMKTCAT